MTSLLKEIRDTLKERIKDNVQWITPEVAICLGVVDDFFEEMINRGKE